MVKHRNPCAQRQEYPKYTRTAMEKSRNPYTQTQGYPKNTHR